MDRAAQLATGLNTDVLKEPRGFIKFIQVIMAIFAFATTCGHSSSSSYSIRCPNQSIEQHFSMQWGYPPVLSVPKNGIQSPVCNSTQAKSLVLPYGDFASPSQFYVFIGVMAFLYSLAAIVLYVKFDHLYRNNDKVPIVDCITTVVFAAMFLIASSAWAQGLSDLKYYSNPEEFFSNNLPDCDPNVGGATCRVVGKGNYAGLNVSIIFGFANMALWAGNLWFLYKETSWFQSRNPPEQQQAPTMQTPETPGMSPGGGMGPGSMGSGGGMGPGMTPGMGQV